MSQSVGSNGVVIAFEPQEKIFRELYMNMLINNCSNVIPIRCALGNNQAVMKIRQDVPDNEGASYLMPDGTGQDVITVRLDDFNLTNVSFIKIDTENTELDVLNGARKIIIRDRPIILIEIQGNDVRASRNKEDMHEQALQVKKLLDELQYNLSWLGSAEHIAIPRTL
jgi:FkbM family methyltransferase